jgi:drug/metabolite transporter (DMT)-like permease
MMRNQRALARWLLLATALVWGATFTLVKSALADASPLVFNVIRMGLATAALAAVNWRALRQVTRVQLRAGALVGLFLAAGYELQTLGLASTTPAKSAFLTGLVVVFVPMLTLVPALRPEGTVRPRGNAAAGALLALTGLVLLTTPAGSTLRQLLHIAPGDLLSIGCAVAFAAHLISLEHAAHLATAGLLATLQVGFCTLVMLAAAPLRPMHLHWTPRLVVAFGVCSLLATAAAFTIQSFAQQHLPPTQTVLLLTLEPVFAALTGLAVLHEGMDHRSLAGAGLILLGILAVELLPSTHGIEIPA